MAQRCEQETGETPVRVGHVNINTGNWVLCVWVGVLPACVSMCHMCAWHPQRLEEGIRFPQTGVIDGCELSVDGRN